MSTVRNLCDICLQKKKSVNIKSEAIILFGYKNKFTVYDIDIEYIYIYFVDIFLFPFALSSLLIS